jgi:hypothetical protein
MMPLDDFSTPPSEPDEQDFLPRKRRDTGEWQNWKIRQVGVGVEVKDDRIGWRSIGVQKRMAGSEIRSIDFAFEKDLSNANVAGGHRPSRTEIDDGRSLIATLGNILPIRKISGLDLFGFGIGAREDERRGARRTRDPERTRDGQSKPNDFVAPDRLQRSVVTIFPRER